MQKFKSYLNRQIKELDELEAIWFNQEQPWDTVEWITEQISLKAGKLGLADLVTKPICSLHDARAYIAQCLQATKGTEYLSVTEAAQKLNISPRTIYALVRSGRLKCWRIGNGRGVIRFRPTDFENFRAPTGLRHLHL